MKKTFLIMAVASAMICTILVGCGQSNQQQQQQQTNNMNTNAQSGAVELEKVVATPTSADIFFSNRDYIFEQDSDSPISINLDGDFISASTEDVNILNSVVTITKEGTYIFTGTLNDGQIVVDMADDTHKAQIILDNVNINCSTSAGINVVSADKVFVSMAENSKNSITANISNQDSIDAGIFSRSDITLNGNGELDILVTNGDGIVGKDELTITSGTYNIIADGHGLDANDSIAIADGVFNITSQKDGMHSEHNTNVEKGNIYILNGEFNINSVQDGISAGGFLEIHDGNFNIITNNGWKSAPVKVATQNNKTAGRQQGTTQQTQTSVEDDTPSMKGLKATLDLYIFGGEIILDCYDDAIHSDKKVEIHGGNFEIGTADDAIHSNWDTIIAGGTINIISSFEGIEGQRINISGGYIDMYCGDDGINAATSSVDPNDSTIVLNISGGTIIMDTNSEGDGVDSNGSILITGGDILISSTVDNRDTTLDSQYDSIITGGKFIATGSNSGTLQNFSTGSTQGSIVVSLSAMQNGRVTLTDEKGEVLVDFEPVKQYQAITISMPEIIEGGTYTLTAGEYSETIKMDSLQYGKISSSSGRR